MSELHGLALFARGWIPENNVSRAPGGKKALAVLRETKAVYIVVVFGHFQGAHLPATCRIPQHDRAPPRSSGEAAAIRGDGDGVGPPGQARSIVQFLARGHLPEPNAVAIVSHQ